MSYKNVLTILSEVEDVAPTIEAALPFLTAEGAHLEVLALGIDRTQTGYYFAGATAMMHEETLAQAQSKATAIDTEARRVLEQSEISWGINAMMAQSATVAGLVARRARFADLVILPQPYGEGRSMDAPVLVEAAMFQGQSAALVLPNRTAPLAMPKTAVIAWNESSEALVAVRRALPMLVAADKVSVLIIDPAHNAAEVADPGAELSKLLSRHGANVEVSIEARTMNNISAQIQRHIRDIGADLLVMGAYGHSRFREAILGGATRNLLEQAEVPLLMAH